MIYGTINRRRLTSMVFDLVRRNFDTYGKVMKARTVSLQPALEKMLSCVPKDIDRFCVYIPDFRTYYRLSSMTTKSIVGVLDDMLTWNEIADKYGTWVLSEYESQTYQFSRAAGKILDLKSMTLVDRVSEQTESDEVPKGAFKGARKLTPSTLKADA